MNSSEYLLSLEKFGIKFGLDNVWSIVEQLDHPERAFQSIHIAGTNGKGSVTAMVDAALRAAGHRSARYTSPHLIDLRERFVIDGRPVDQATLNETVSHVRAAVEALQRGGRLPVHPTFFEVTTAVAFELFRRAAGQGAEVLPVIANWPVARHAHWETLLRARAIENQAYVAGCNRIGHDGADLDYVGGSRIIDHAGNVLADAGGEETVIFAPVDPAALREYRRKLPFLADMR